MIFKIKEFIWIKNCLIWIMCCCIGIREGKFCNRNIDFFCVSCDRVMMIIVFKIDCIFRILLKKYIYIVFFCNSF